MGIRKNMVSNLLLTSSAIIFPLITFPYVTHTLSNQSIGQYFFVDSFTQYFIIFSAVGIPFYGIREVAKVKDDNQKRSKLVIELFAIQITLAVVFSAIFILMHYFIPALKNDFSLIKVGCLGIISTSFLIEWFFQGMENFTFITGRSLVIKTLSVIGIVLLVKRADDNLVYYLIITLIIFLNAALNFIYYLTKFHTKYTGKLNFKQHFKPLLVLFSINISVSVYAVLDTIILGLLTNPENVSYYNVPLKLVKIFWTVVNGTGLVLIPRIAGYFTKNDTGGIQLMMQKSLNIVFLLTIPFSVFCMMFSDEILMIISGDKYVYASGALKILSIVPLIISVCNVCGTQFLMPIGQEKKILYASLLGLIVSLSLNFFLIPHLKFIGAAITCVTAESVVCIYLFISASKKIAILIDYPLLMQILISLVLTAALKFVLALAFHGSILIIAAISAYCLIFILLQWLYFKNTFIYSVVRIKNKY